MLSWDDITFEFEGKEFTKICFHFVILVSHKIVFMNTNVLAAYFAVCI